MSAGKQSHSVGLAEREDAHAREGPFYNAVPKETGGLCSRGPGTFLSPSMAWEPRTGASGGCDLLLRNLLTRERCVHLWVHWSTWGNGQRPKGCMTLARAASVVRRWWVLNTGRRWEWTLILDHHPLLQPHLNSPLLPPTRPRKLQ